MSSVGWKSVGDCVHMMLPMFAPPPPALNIAQQGLPPQSSGPSQATVNEESGHEGMQLPINCIITLLTQHTSPTAQVISPQLTPSESVGGTYVFFNSTAATERSTR